MKRAFDYQRNGHRAFALIFFLVLAGCAPASAPAAEVTPPTHARLFATAFIAKPNALVIPPAQIPTSLPIDTSIPVPTAVQAQPPLQASLVNSIEAPTQVPTQELTLPTIIPTLEVSTQVQTVDIVIDPTAVPTNAPADVSAEPTVESVISAQIVESASVASVSNPYSAPSYSGNKYILVDISDQHMFVYEGDVVVYSFVASTGMNNATRAGLFSVLDKIPNAYGATWNIWMPNWLGIYWAGSLENGIHALPILSNGAILWEGYLGTPISYGCVVLGTYESKLLYDWAEVGTPVEIQW